MAQALLFDNAPHKFIQPFPAQLMKWIGNKQRFAHQIASLFPGSFNTYFEPFLGSGGVLATLFPKRALASDAFAPLVEIFQTLKNDPETLKEWYSENWKAANGDKKKEGYEKIKASFNNKPNGADLLYLCRACYGGVVRFRKSDGYMSTPCGPHDPITPESFSRRVDEWNLRVQYADFEVLNYKDAMRRAGKGDLVYCDPHYSHSQSILYGGQDFKLEELFEEIGNCKFRGVYVALSIDGKKKSGDLVCELPIPERLFEEEIYVNTGRSMLKRFQMNGKTLEKEEVSDRLLLTYPLYLRH